MGQAWGFISTWWMEIKGNLIKLKICLPLSLANIEEILTDRKAAQQWGTFQVDTGWLRSSDPQGWLRSSDPQPEAGGEGN